MPNNEIPEQVAYKPAEFARRIGFSRDTVYAWVANGDIRSTRVGKSILIPATELQRIAGGDAA